MASSSENDSEILLGNKQLLAVFAVVALLLAVAFTGGYMLGKSSTDKKGAGNGEVAKDSGVTETIHPDETQKTKADPPVTPSEDPTPEPLPVVAKAVPKHKQPDVSPAPPEPVLGKPKPNVIEGTTPKVGQTFVQVAALTHTQAEATADVLRKQKFHARIAPRPGSATIYRVLVGPVSDPGELSSTRDALRKIGFRDVIVQRY